MPNENVSLRTWASLIVRNGSRFCRIWVQGLSGPQRENNVGADMMVVCRVLERGLGQKEWAGGLPWAGAGNRAEKWRKRRKSCDWTAISVFTGPWGCCQVFITSLGHQNAFMRCHRHGMSPLCPGQTPRISQIGFILVTNHKTGQLANYWWISPWHPDWYHHLETMF